MLKQSLQQKLQQKLTPQQIQVMKLVELPTLQFEQQLLREIEENPALEVRDDHTDSLDEQRETGQDDHEFSHEDFMNQDEKTEFNYYSSDQKSVQDIAEQVYREQPSVLEYLLRQADMETFSDKQHLIAQYIIGNLDEAGYFRRTIQSISNELAFRENVITSPEEVEKVLKVIKTFEPNGIAAATLQECLIIQLKKKEPTEIILQALQILQNDFVNFTKKKYGVIKDRYGVSDKTMREVLDVIKRLNPKPVSSVSDVQLGASVPIMPDFLLEVTDEHFSLSLNQRNTPEIRVSKEYEEMIKDYKSETKQDKQASAFLKKKLDTAKNFISAIEQRKNTLMVTMQAILEEQREYFLKGDPLALKPMILKTIAGKTGMDISTVSRVSNSKYIQTHFGIVPLKQLFSEGLINEKGEEVSSNKILTLIQKIIDEENKQKPLTDDKLVEYLKAYDVAIARRTVAKFREKLNIPVARLRKEF